CRRRRGWRFSSIGPIPSTVFSYATHGTPVGRRRLVRQRQPLLTRPRPRPRRFTMTDSRRALVLVDIQNEYFNGPLEIQHPPRDQALAQILRAIDVAREAGVPIAAVQHEMPEGAPVFVSGTPGWELHSDFEAALPEGTKRFTKNYASIFDDTDALAWLKENSVDTVTLVGFMTNNCVIGSAVGAEPLGITAEVLSDATGAISIANEAGSVAAQQVHETLMAVLNSNLATVATTDAWAEAVRSGSALQGSDLGSSAMQGRSEH